MAGLFCGVYDVIHIFATLDCVNDDDTISPRSLRLARFSIYALIFLAKTPAHSLFFWFVSADCCIHCHHGVNWCIGDWRD
jgi:hypothetical protein